MRLVQHLKRLLKSCQTRWIVWRKGGGMKRLWFGGDLRSATKETDAKYLEEKGRDSECQKHKRVNTKPHVEKIRWAEGTRWWVLTRFKMLHSFPEPLVSKGCLRWTKASNASFFIGPSLMGSSVETRCRMHYPCLTASLKYERQVEFLL